MASQNKKQVELKAEAREIASSMHGRHWHVSAPAKVNLRLKVLGRRADGYHLLSMLNATCSLSDDVVISFGLDGETCAEMDPPSVTPLPSNKNLAVRAHTEFWGAFGCAEPPINIHVRISKRIPVGGGLGGGSSDAGAVLRVLREVFGASVRTVLGLSEVDCEALITKAALVCGADVPFAYQGGVCWVTGVGEQVRPLGDGPLWSGRVLLAVPSVPVPTLPFYEFYRRQHPVIVPTSDLEMERLRGKPSEVLLEELLHNDFERDVAGLVPEVGQGIALARQFFPRTTSLTGSGSCFFSLVRVEEEHRIDSYRRALEEKSIAIHEVRL